MKKQSRHVFAGVLLLLLAMPALFGAERSPGDLGDLTALSIEDFLNNIMDDPQWGEMRRAILMADLKELVQLTDEQMTTLDQIGRDTHAALFAKYGQIHAIREEIRVLAEDWETNFEQIVHLQFQIYIREVQIRFIHRQMGGAVHDVLTEEQAHFLPLVVKVVNEAYHLFPPRPQPEES
ncbi:MAG: hypothetical protein JXQ27_10915 [Acidobacteria bacterium]|nr:hypothetical protein [Acidobacteriota bacterium]